MYPRGWIKVVLTSVEIVTITQDEGYNLEGWVMDGSTGGLELCSSDCQKERDDCINALEPQPQFSGAWPKGYQAKFEELRYEALKVRGLSHRITRAKLL